MDARARHDADRGAGRHQRASWAQGGLSHRGKGEEKERHLTGLVLAFVMVNGAFTTVPRRDGGKAVARAQPTC